MDLRVRVVDRLIFSLILGIDAAGVTVYSEGGGEEVCMREQLNALEEGLGTLKMEIEGGAVNAMREWEASEPFRQTEASAAQSTGQEGD